MVATAARAVGHPAPLITSASPALFVAPIDRQPFPRHRRLELDRRVDRIVPTGALPHFAPVRSHRDGGERHDLVHRMNLIEILGRTWRRSPPRDDAARAADRAQIRAYFASRGAPARP